MQIISFSKLRGLSQSVANLLDLNYQSIETHSFPSQERSYVFPPLKEEIIFFHTFQARTLDADLLNVLCALEYLKTQDISKILFVCTYLPYLRMYQHDQKGCMPLGILKDFLKKVAVSTIHVVDPHTQKDGFISPISPLPLLRKLKSDFEFVVPDRGGFERIKDIEKDIIVLEKARSENSIKVSHSNPLYFKGKKFLILDDLVDSGKTIEAAKSYLLNCGAAEVKTYATHTLHGKVSDFTTNSFGQETGVEVMDLCPLLAEYIRKIA